jgi:hypothetical protein
MAAGGSSISRRHHYVRLPKVTRSRALRDNLLPMAKTFEHLGYGRACAVQVSGEYLRPLSAQLFEEVDRLSPGC